MIAMYSRQCGSQDAANLEITALREAGHKVVGPVKTIGPNRRTEVWEFSASVDAVQPRAIFNDLLERMASLSEYQSLELLREHANQISTNEFQLLLGRAIRQPHWLPPSDSLWLSRNMRASKEQITNLFD